MIATSTILAISAAVAVVGAGVSAYGMYAQGQAQKQMADYNAKVQQNNAAMKMQQGQYEAGLIAQRNRRLRGAQAAASGKAGVDVSGSVSDVMYDSALQGEVNRLSAIYKGQIGSDESASAASLSRASGESAVSQSYWGAAGTLLSGAGQGLGYVGMSKYAQAGFPTISG